MTCPKAIRVQASFDGEVDALVAAEIEMHVAQCADCACLLRDLEATRAVARHMPRVTAPRRLVVAISSALDEVAPQLTRNTAPPVRQSPAAGRRFWLGTLCGGSAAALAALMAFILLVPAAGGVPDELAAAHLRSLMPAHLVDVESTDRHTVKPWFAGHADVSPVVADFAQQGFPLIGGRADYLDHQRAAVLVYRHGAHILNVFAWAATRQSTPSDATRDGFHMVFWRDGDLAYGLVSDAGWGELRALQSMLRAANTP